MTELTFDYIKTKNDKPVILLPVKCGERKTSLPALVDSGADVSISYKSIGELFGIKFLGEGEETIGGFWADGKGWAASALLFLTNPASEPLAIQLLWANKHHDPEEDFAFLLGRRGIFDKFNVEICESEKKVIFREISN